MRPFLITLLVTLNFLGGLYLGATYSLEVTAKRHQEKILRCLAALSDECSEEELSNLLERVR
jgi:hypothetical protein